MERDRAVGANPSDLVVLYRTGRARVADLVADADDATVVPACPAWTVHDLVAHVSGIAERLTTGDYPARDAQPWIDEIRARARRVPTADLIDRWARCDAATASLIEAGNWQLVVDLLVHEQDLAGALRRGGPGDLEVTALVPLLLSLHTRSITSAGLAPLAVTDGTASWTTGPGPSGCTLRCPASEATRALASRRTRDEVRVIADTGDLEPYLEILDRHGPMPTVSLNEARPVP